MEKQAALIMWNRSINRHGLRYISMVSDGDSKTIAEIQKADPYSGVVVEKHECLNHVGKRMGTQLRNLVKQKSKEKPKVTLGGKGFGKLRPEVIGKLQKYFTKAVRSNDTVPKMQRAIKATLLHSASTDEEPHHNLCPSGEDSWCFYQRALASSIPLETLDHKKQVGTPLCKLVVDNITPIYDNMCDEKLLRKCLLQATQNVNESLHSVIWARCPKHIFATKPRVEIATAVAIGEFNFGSSSTIQFMDSLNLPVGQHMVKSGRKRDHVRVYKAEVASSEQAKRFRESKMMAKQMEEERLA